jgi:hypothetical protein
VRESERERAREKESERQRKRERARVRRTNLASVGIAERDANRTAVQPESVPQIIAARKGGGGFRVQAQKKTP